MGDYQGSVVREGLYFGECPRWHDGRLWYSDFFDHAVHALTPGGADERVVEVAGQPAGLGWMPDGSLLIVSMIDRRVLRLGLDGSLAEHADLRLGARLAVGRDGPAGWLGLPCSSAVGDQPGDRQEGLFEVLSSSEVALEGAPLLVLGVRVLYADPFR